jgi:hypothetical protein
VTVAALPVQTVTVTQDGSSIAIDENDGSGIRIYPNPNRGIFRIVVVSGKITRMGITVQDLNGRIYMKNGKRTSWKRCRKPATWTPNSPLRSSPSPCRKMRPGSSLPWKPGTAIISER